MSELLRIELQKGDRRFAFDLLRRPLALGTAGTILYHWMDSRQFRRRRLGPNFRSYVDAWWADAGPRPGSRRQATPGWRRRVLLSPSGPEERPPSDERPVTRSRSV
jgi:hypothetical protein